MPANTPPPTAASSNGSSNASGSTPTTPTDATCPAIAATAAVPLNNTRKRTPDEYTKNFDLNEISPLRTPSETATTATANGSKPSAASEGSKCNNGHTTATATTVLLPPVVLNMSRSPAAVDGQPDVADSATAGGKPRNKFRGTCDDIVGRLELGGRARRPFLVVCALCAVLLVALIVLACLWPRVPAYMRAPVCVEKECLAAGAQVSGNGNVSVRNCLLVCSFLDMRTSVSEHTSARACVCV